MRLAALLVCAGLSAAATAQRPAASAGQGIYVCRDKDGRPLLQDRRIAECMDREQEQRNRDGSVRGALAPPPTADEQARMDVELAQLRQARASSDEALKYDRLLKIRFPDEAAHDRARVAALERLRGAMGSSERRLRELADERRTLQNEAEFYKGRKMPDRLRQQIETNGAGAAAQRQLMKQQEAEIADIDRRFDAERERLRKLWRGAQPGSVGPVPRADAASAPR